ncbi:hypothetical protein L1987_57078 [Smallanthus sonchifolius]|uniref:Uncharacterized protein n=1 Tax=Smallanthus sonchifolius TaxID=185202 RepID=A0ACB9DC14_9ASTR|nr:hypothetical protein L1987_57078 [Smallanthus sonchifolius]
MTHPAILAASTPINSVNSRLISPFLTPCSFNPSLTVTISVTRRSNRLPWIKAAAATVDNPTLVEEGIPSKVGARVRVKVPVTVYHVPKVAEVDLKGKEGKIKEYVAVWKGKNISANLPYKVEFFEKVEGRGEAPVKFVAHLKEDEFEYVD